MSASLKKFESMYNPEELDSLGDRWLTNSRGSQVIRYETYLSIIRKLLGKDENDKYLDIACAQSQILNLIKKEFPKVELYGSDISSNVIKWNCNQFHRINYLQCSLPEICFENKKFDVISAFEVIYYLSKDDQINSIKNIANRLNMGGYMIFSGGLDQGERFFSEDWLIKNTKEIIEIEQVVYIYAKLYRLIETPLLKGISIIGRIREYRQLTSEDRNILLSKTNSKLTLMSMKLVSNNFLYFIFNILQFTYNKFAFSILKWQWLPRVCSKLSKSLYGAKGKTNIILVCKKTDNYPHG